MPVHPPTLPPNLHNLLSSLRAPIFLTNHNPTCARLGTKYLKKPLMGPRLMEYYPKPLPSFRSLNVKFANLTGQPEYTSKSWAYPSLPKDQIVPEGWIEAERKKEAKGGMFFDAREHRRMEKVERRKRIGKGAPRKGECARRVLLTIRTGEKSADGQEEVIYIWLFCTLLFYTGQRIYPMYTLPDIPFQPILLRPRMAFDLVWRTVIS
jgi:small subunit ribosomal protein S33